MPTNPTHVRYVYRCRLCGLVFFEQPRTKHTKKDAWGSICESLGISIEAKRYPLVALVTAHDYCSDGSIGIADLQGARVEKKK